MTDDQDWSSVVMRWPSWFADLIADLVAEQDVTMSELVQSLASRGLPEPGEDPFGASYKRVVWAELSGPGVAQTTRAPDTNPLEVPVMSDVSHTALSIAVVEALAFVEGSKRWMEHAADAPIDDSTCQDAAYRLLIRAEEVLTAVVEP